MEYIIPDGMIYFKNEAESLVSPQNAVILIKIRLPINHLKQIKIKTLMLNSRSDNFLAQAKWLVLIFSVGTFTIIFGTIVFFPESTGHWKLFGILTGIPGGVVFGLANYITTNRWREIPFWILLGSFTD
jgi:hypothetical protein